MGARTGEQFIQRLRQQAPEVWHRGERVKDITTEPGFANGIRSLAGLYDRQFEYADTMLFDSPDVAEPVPRSFMIPKTKQELHGIGEAMKCASNYSLGMMGRDPSYLNRAMSAYAAGADFLSDYGEGFGEHARDYHRYLRDNDLSSTHTLINPQINRAVSAAHQADPFLAARVKEERDDGIVIKGARMLATLPVSDEIMAFPSTLLRNPEEDAPYAFAFAIPNSTPGLKFLCRESMDYGRNHFDHPLGSRFEELDAVVLFDDVFVPWEKVFIYRNVEACNNVYARTGAIVHMSHQVVCKNIAKTEFLLGLVSLMIDAIGVEKFQHIHEKTTEIWVNLETMKAFRRAAEVDAAPNEHGVMTPAWAPLDAARQLYPRLYPRMIEIVQQIGASGLVAMPTQADLEGPLAGEVEKYFQSARLQARDRIPLFRLAWDAAVSAFGSRQVLYERFFFGDPVRMAGVVFQKHDRTPYMEMVRDFLRARQDEEPEHKPARQPRRRPRQQPAQAALGH